MSVLQIKGWLKGQQHAHVRDDWIEACLDWLKSEHQGGSLPNLNFKSMVYEQWLDSDLSEIALPTLPAGIGEQTHTTLNGRYNLQMKYIEDVSEPAFSQLLKMKGKENTNMFVSATPATQSQLNVKSSRMLMLHLTDGHQSLQAMEYSPIPHLNVKLPPGTKVFVEGSIPCRLGVLMLSAKNIKVLGGEVDALLEINSQVQVLSRALTDQGRRNIPENFRNSITSKALTSTPEKRSAAPSNHWKPSCADIKNELALPSDEDLLMNDDELVEEMKEIEMLERQHCQEEAEEWPDDVDDDMLQSIPDSITTGSSFGQQDHIFVDAKPLLTTQPVCRNATKRPAQESYNTQWCASNSRHNTTSAFRPQLTNEISTDSTTYNPKSEPTSTSSQSKPTINKHCTDNGLDHYSNRDVVKQEVLEEVIMISDDSDNEDFVKRETDNENETEDIVSLQDSFTMSHGTFKIQGNFTTLITGLSYDSVGWKLSGTVTDDGGEVTLDVDLANEVLTKLIGFSVPEMVLMKKEMKSNKKEVGKRIKSGLAQCQQALKEMYCGMKIRKDPSQSHPCVISVDYP